LPGWKTAGRDSSGLAPNSEEWLAFWEGVIDEITSGQHSRPYCDRIPLEVVDRIIEGLQPSSNCMWLIASRADRKLALDSDSCMRILGEGGFLTARGIGIINLGRIPDGLTAAETERFLRENGDTLT